MPRSLIPARPQEYDRNVFKSPGRIVANARDDPADNCAELYSGGWSENGRSLRMFGRFSFPVGDILEQVLIGSFRSLLVGGDRVHVESSEKEKRKNGARLATEETS